MVDVLDLADRLWRGEVSTATHHPVSHLGGLAEICDDVAFVPSFANVSAIRTGDGLVLIDTGSAPLAATIHDTLRTWAPRDSRGKTRLNTAVYSHGHIDHVFGVPVWEEESKETNWPLPTVIAHHLLPHRFDRYIMTAGYNTVINARQFGFKDFSWPTTYRYPDQTYHETLSVSVGGVDLELRHEKGETDDHTVTWIPKKKVLCCGDLFIWASPNAGNPQKVQRFPKEWAQALRHMITLEPEFLLPGHGLPVVGADRVHEALTNTASLLESLVEQTLLLMNQGARLSEVIHAVSVPTHLAALPYLQPVYDEPEFIVRNIWRLYGGWWDGNPANLLPAPDKDLSREIASLAGGAQKLVDRALLLAESGSRGHDLALSCHLVELAWLATPLDQAIGEARREIFTKRADRATSTMAKGVFRWAGGEGAEHT